MNEDLFEWLPSNELDYQYQTYIEKIFSKHLSSQNFSYVVIIYLIVMAVVMYKLQKNLIVVIIPAVLFCLLFIKSRKNSTHNNDEISQQNYEWREGDLTKISARGRHTKILYVDGQECYEFPFYFFRGRKGDRMLAIRIINPDGTYKYFAISYDDLQKKSDRI